MERDDEEEEVEYLIVEIENVPDYIRHEKRLFLTVRAAQRLFSLSSPPL